MRLRKRISLCFAGVLALLPAAAQSNICAESSQLQWLAAEMRSLRIELLQEKAEKIQVRIDAVRQQLGAAEAERNQVSANEQEKSQELADLQQRLADPALRPEHRGELESYRTQLTTLTSSTLADHAARLAKREAELRVELDREERLRNQLLETLRLLGAKPRT